MTIEPTHICTFCYTESAHETHSTIHWKIASIITLAVGVLAPPLSPLFLVGVIWLIWLIVADKPKCPSCKKRKLISVATPRAQGIRRGTAD